jgi:23S rRNA (adenine2030-N6)-methyltransferase
LAIPAILCAELGVQPYDSSFGLHGCGMVIVNPPWQFDELLKQLLPELRQRLQLSKHSQTRLDWLTPAP